MKKEKTINEELQNLADLIKILWVNLSTLPPHEQFEYNVLIQREQELTEYDNKVLADQLIKDKQAKLKIRMENVVKILKSIHGKKDK